MKNLNINLLSRIKNDLSKNCHLGKFFISDNLQKKFSEYKNLLFLKRTSEKINPFFKTIFLLTFFSLIFVFGDVTSIITLIIQRDFLISIIFIGLFTFFILINLIIIFLLNIFLNKKCFLKKDVLFIEKLWLDFFEQNKNEKIFNNQIIIIFNFYKNKNSLIDFYEKKSITSLARFIEIYVKEIMIMTEIYKKEL